MEMPETCQTCQGNGEIVTDWEQYLHGPNFDSVAECSDCGGEGTLDEHLDEPTP